MLFRIVWTVILTTKTSTLGSGTTRALIHGRVVRFSVPLMAGRVLMMAASPRARPTGPMAAAATMAGASPTTPTMAWVGAPRRGHWRPTTVLCASAAYLRRDPRAAGDGFANGALMAPHLFQILMSHSVSRCASGVGLWRVARGRLLQAPVTTLHLLWLCHTLQLLSPGLTFSTRCWMKLPLHAAVACVAVTWRGSLHCLLGWSDRRAQLGWSQ